jgi:HAD superfamily hydrolase (TIGR01450 family)
MPQAIEWSFATPKMSAAFPSSSPIARSFVFRYAAIMPDRRPATSQVSDRSDLRVALRGVEGFVLDADGVLILKGEPLPGSREALARLDARGTPYRVVTNFSLAHRSTLVARFADRGVDLPADHVITASSAAAAHTAEHFGGRPLYVIAAPDALREFDGQHLVTREEAEASPADVGAVVIGDGGDDLSFRAQDTAFRLIRGGAAFLAMHRNPWWLTPKGPTLDAGAIVVGLEYATGVKATVLGKPSPVVFRQALAGLRRDLGRRVPASHVAMVGDDPDADVRAAQRVGLRGILVLTGKVAAHETARLVGGRRRAPDAIAPSLADIVAALD